MHFFTEKLIYKSNSWKLFSCATWPNHSIKSGRILKLCKPLTLSRVCITHVYIRQCKHRKHFLLLKYFQVWNTSKSFEEFYLWTSCHQYVFFLTHLLRFSPSICYRPFPCFTSIILLSQVFSTLPVKGQVSEVVSENIYPLHEYKEDTKSSISFLNHGATNCKEKKRLLGQKNSQWCVKKGWGKKENDKYTLWPTFCKSFWKFIFPWLWVTMPSVVSIIDYNRSSITIFRQCDNWLLIDWLLIIKN